MYIVMYMSAIFVLKTLSLLTFLQKSQLLPKNSLSKFFFHTCIPSRKCFPGSGITNTQWNMNHNSVILWWFQVVKGLHELQCNNVSCFFSIKKKTVFKNSSSNSLIIEKKYKGNKCLMIVWKSDEKMLIFGSLISPCKIILFEE